MHGEAGALGRGSFELAAGTSGAVALQNPAIVFGERWRVHAGG